MTMMSEYDAVSAVLQKEGWPKLTNHPWDKGRWTKGGITLATLTDYLGRPASVDELAALPESTARAIYQKVYLQPYTELGVPDPLRLLLFDIAVTSWHDDAVKALQVGLRALRRYSGRVDGVMGPGTRGALSAALSAPDEVNALYASALRDRFIKLAREATDDPKVQKFLRENHDTDLTNLVGWVARCAEFVR